MVIEQRGKRREMVTARTADLDIELSPMWDAYQGKRCQVPFRDTLALWAVLHA